MADDFFKPVSSVPVQDRDSFFKPIGENQEPSRLRSVLSAFPKGLIKGASSLSKLHDPIGSLISGGGISANEEGVIEKVLPTQDKFAEGVLEKAGELVPSVALGGQGLVRSAMQSILAGITGQTTKSLGGGPLTQAVAEVLGLGIPGFGKKISPTKAQKELVNFARKMGMSESEIAPAIQSEKKASLLSKIAPRGERLQEALKKSRGSIREIYTGLKKSPEAQQHLSEEVSTQLMEDIGEKLIEMPSSVRKLIMKDIVDLSRGGFSGKNLINFYQDVNFQYGRGAKQLGSLLDPIKEAISSISPELGEKFALTNNLYSNWAKTAGKLRPNMANELFHNLLKLGQTGKIMYGIASGNVPLLVEVVGESAAKQIAREMLINPRFQNIGRQMINSANQGKYGIAKTLGEKLLSMINPQEQKSMAQGKTPQ